ncbi:MAG: hypothetical protein ACRD2P_15805, partial [Terriglobia bacterium]
STNRSERSEEAHDKLREESAFLAPYKQILRCAQDDISAASHSTIPWLASNPSYVPFAPI